MTLTEAQIREIEEKAKETTNCSVHERCIWELALEGAKRNAETAIHRMEKAEARIMELAESRSEIIEQRNMLYAQVKLMREALVKINDGGVPLGVQANVEQRMLAMCDLSRTALAAVDALEGK